MVTITTEQFRLKEKKELTSATTTGAGGEHRRRVYAALAVDLRIPQHGKELGDGGKKAGVAVCKMPTAA